MEVGEINKIVNQFQAIIDTLERKTCEELRLKPTEREVEIFNISTEGDSVAWTAVITSFNDPKNTQTHIFTLPVICIEWEKPDE